ncbi:hypothetical protein [Rugamonas rubra]|uniref:hypothetical protein n=1 Tax=Rugamonas rubra TaxID=758825 RepID=UPI001113CA09|nr:hypothetical protein [Rugamonas rubra]
MAASVGFLRRGIAAGMASLGAGATVVLCQIKRLGWLYGKTGAAAKSVFEGRLWTRAAPGGNGLAAIDSNMINSRC